MKKQTKMPPAATDGKSAVKNSRKDTIMVAQKETEIKQEDKAIRYMKENGSATVRELFIYCNINSPTKVISNLHRLGVIEKGWVKKPGKQPYRAYFLREEI